MTDTLIADGDGIYDPAAYSDRLVLGLKGTILEMADEPVAALRRP